MARTITVWFPEGFLENQRDQSHSNALRLALAAEGVECLWRPMEDAGMTDADLFFVGSWRYFDQAPLYRELCPGKPVVHYNWDLYPFQVHAKTDPKTDRTGRARPTAQATRWLEYVEELKAATEVWVPSQGVVMRTHEFCGANVKCVVVKCCFYPWEVDDLGTDWWTISGVDLSEPYVMDVMREYTDEPMVGAVAEVCAELSVPCIQSDHRLSWDEFRCAVSRTSLLVSSYTEASTGGLTLLEGYWHGREVLVSDSPRQGAGEYFGTRANYFDWRTGRKGLRNMVEFCAKVGQPSEEQIQLELAGCRGWAERNYGVKAFARRLASGFRRILGK